MAGLVCMVGLDSRVCPGGPNTATVDSPGGPQSGGGGGDIDRMTC